MKFIRAHRSISQKLGRNILIILAILVILFGFVTHIRAQNQEMMARIHYPPEGQFLTVEGKQIHVVIKGKSGPDVVLIHGLSGNARDFTQALAERLALRHRVLVFDRPGLGYSTDLGVGKDTIVDQARVLKKAAAQLGADKPIVLGHSYGGAVALAWAVRFPGRISGLVLLSTPSQVWEGGMSPFYLINSIPLLAKISTPLLAAYVSEARIERELDTVFIPQKPPLGYGSHIGTGLALQRQTMVVNARHRANLKAELYALVPLYPSLDLPTEILHGDADDTVSIDIHSVPLSRQIPKANLKILEGIGHMPHHVVKDDVIDAINRVAKIAGLRRPN